MIRLNPKYYNRTFIGIVVIMIAAVLLRMFALHTFDLHIDEITYAQFAKTIDAGQLPRGYDGKPFFLHPPGYFAVSALWRAIFWHGGNIFKEFMTMRTLNVILAGLSVPFLIGIVKQITSNNKLALLSGVLFAVDPFIIRQNSRGLMETQTMLLLLIGLWLLLRNIEKPVTDHKRLWVGIGCVFGLAMVTKDVAIIFSVITFALMAFRKVGPQKHAYRYIIPGAIFPYTVWLTIVAISGNAGAFMYQKTLGIQRFFGLLQTTGFNSSNAPSKGGTIIQTIPHYATSYGIMGLGAAASFLLLFSKDHNRRRWGCVGTAATLLLGYQFVGGTFEEQYLYYLLVPSIVSVIVGFIELRHILPKAFRRTVSILATSGIIGAICFGIFAYTINVQKTSTGWQTTIEWVGQNVPVNSTICAFGQGQFLLGGHGFNVCNYSSMAAIQSNHVQYIIVSEKLTNLNYEPISASTYAQVKKDSTVAFSTYSPDAGEFKVIKMNNPGTPVYELPIAHDVVKSPKAVAAAPHAQIPPTSSTSSATAANELPNTGVQITSLAKIFFGTVIAGAGLTYSFTILRFYLKNRRSYREQLTSGYATHHTAGSVQQTLIVPNRSNDLDLEEASA